MNIVEKINDNLERLPLTLQSEALNFVEYLLFKNERQPIPKYLPKESVIQSTPAVCFGKPRIRHTRIPIWLLVSFRNQGADNQELLRNYPSLTLNDLQTAWNYYSNHKNEIDQEITYQNGFDYDKTIC